MFSLIKFRLNTSKQAEAMVIFMNGSTPVVSRKLALNLTYPAFSNSTSEKQYASANTNRSCLCSACHSRSFSRVSFFIESGS